MKRQQDVPPTAVIEADEEGRLAVVLKLRRLPEQVHRMETATEIAAHIVVDVRRKDGRFAGRYHGIYSTLNAGRMEDRIVSQF